MRLFGKEDVNRNEKNTHHAVQLHPVERIL